MNIHIAIDGPAGTGKSTLARRVAKEYGFIYIDTGAMYRALALACLESGINFDDAEKVAVIANTTKVELEFANGKQQTLLNGEDVTEKIRIQEIAKGASLVAKIKEVRERLVGIQQNIAKSINIVMDGRDVGTVVLPNAQVKIFLTASIAQRSVRRCNELGLDTNGDECAKIMKEIEKRDFEDANRKISPLKQAEDAVLLDSSHLDEDGVFDKIRAIIYEKTKMLPM